MAENALDAELREGTGKGIARKLRAAGRIPAVLYGRGEPAQPLSLDPHALERLLHTSEAGANTLIDLRIQRGRKREGKVVLLKELQREPVHGDLIHVDLYEVDLSHTVAVEVPVHLLGRPQGVELGGILDHTLREIEIECLPRAIPDAIEVDVSGLAVGDSIHVRDLRLPEGVKLLTDPELNVAAVVAPVVEAVEVAEAAEAEEAAPAAEEAPAAEPTEGAE